QCEMLGGELWKNKFFSVKHLERHCQDLADEGNADEKLDNLSKYIQGFDRQCPGAAARITSAACDAELDYLGTQEAVYGAAEELIDGLPPSDAITTGTATEQAAVEKHQEWVADAQVGWKALKARVSDLLFRRDDLGLSLE